LDAKAVAFDEFELDPNPCKYEIAYVSFLLIKFFNIAKGSTWQQLCHSGDFFSSSTNI
jgi:hypothetical protein